MSRPGASEARGKLWLEGSHRCPNSLKVLARDPDIKVFCYEYSSDSADESSEKEEVKQPLINSACKDLKIVEADDNSVTVCGSYDLPLSPRLRQEILDFLNIRLEQEINQEDD